MKLASAKVHFIGIGGIGMCGLAELLHNLGAEVTGSDLGENAQTERLSEMGVHIFKGHSPSQLGEAEVVVYSSAVKSDNSEYQEARRRKIPLIGRAEALAELMRLKRGIAVAGTHGKTTTTSLISQVFLSGKLDPTIVVGGRLASIKTTAQLGKGDWLVAEADESDGSFNRLSPEIVIITNVDNDHLDHYGDFASLKKAFQEFASRIPFYGLLIVYGDDSVTRELFTEFPKRVLFYGFGAENDYQLVKKEGEEYSLNYGGQELGVFLSPLPGQHNALNSTAALITGMEVGLDFEACRKGLESFTGVDRRFQHKGRVGKIDVYDDYGHHPTEVKNVLKAFRDHFPNRSIITLFQPHRYSRTQQCWDEFTQSFSDCDHLFVTEIYPAGEAAIQGVDGKSLASQIKHPSCDYLPVDPSGPVPERIDQVLKKYENPVFLTLGAGTVWRVGEALLNEQMGAS